MSTRDPHERDMEGLLRAHFAEESEQLRAPGDLWSRLEGRLEERRRPFWNRLFGAAEGWASSFTPATAMMVAAIVVAVGVWAVVAEPWRSGSLDEESTAATIVGMDAPQTQAAAQTTAAATTTTTTATTTAATTTSTTTQTTATTTSTAATAAAAPQAASVTAATEAASQSATTTTAAAAQSSMAMTREAPGDYVQGPSAPSATTFKDYGRQPHVNTAEDAVSTFSLDTDRTSYYLALGWAHAGYEVAPDSVRAEEWINAFDYGYDPPPNDGEFAISSDLVSHPLDDGMHLARVAFQAPQVVDDRPLNVTLVLDASGSMSSGNRVAIAREAAETIRQSLGPDDRIAVVHFTTNVLDHLTVEHTGPEDAAVSDSIRRLMPHNSTNVQAGLNLGVRLADRVRRERPDAYNYIILMSDGVANVDATDPFGILETAHDSDARNPLRLITIGVGIENYNDYLLEQLAQHGNGWYRYLNDTAQARATFSRDNWLALSTPFADQTRAQVTWDTEVVKSWRIIGYENRVTPDETFTQDRKEFAEIPSGAATTVFYELELHEWARTAGATKLGTVEVRWVAPSTGQSWSQRADLMGSPTRRFDSAGDPYLQLGAIVALASDRYSALSDGTAGSEDLQQDLAGLNEYLQGLGSGRLGGQDAYQDFAFLLGHMAESAPGSSGYSR